MRVDALGEMIFQTYPNYLSASVLQPISASDKTWGCALGEDATEQNCSGENDLKPD